MGIKRPMSMSNELPKEILLEILRDAVRAPSGDNVQPWRFSAKGSTVSVYNVPGIHNPYLDFDERGSYISHGALLESMCISASRYGYAVTIDLFPNNNDETLVAIVHFVQRGIRTHLLYEAIVKRATNHHPFEERDLEAGVQNIFESAVADIPVTTVFTTDTKDRGSIGRVASRAEVVILEDEEITKSFFDGMVWTEKEEQQKKSGFFVRSLEFNPVQMMVFWLASKPQIMRFLRILRLPQFIANEDAKLYATGSLAGGVSIPNESRENYVYAGRALQRIWLTATSQGLAFQPLVGTCFVAYKVETGRITLPPAYAEDMRTAFAEAKKVLGLHEGIIAFLFRIGYAPTPSTRSSRREPTIDYV
jgi:nitroreductase